MVNRRMEFFIGMTVVVIFVAVAIMTILFGPQQGLSIRGGGKRMTILFEKANGVTNTSKVMKSGIEIGRVYKRELVDNGKKIEVKVLFELNPDAKIYSNEYARVNRTLLGDAAIEFVKNVGYKGEIVELKSTDPIHGAAGGDLVGTVSNIEGDLAKAIKKVSEAAEGLTLFMDNLNHFLGTPDELLQKKNRLQAIFTELNNTLVSVNGLATNMNGIISDKELQANIKKGSAAIPGIIEKVETLMTNANKLTGDFRATIERSHTTFNQVEKNLDNISEFTDALADQGPEFISSISDSAKDIRIMVGNISDLAETLVKEMKDPNTAFGMMSDKEVASSLKGIIRNAEEISLKLQPVVDDARVFTNKIAHKPSSLLWGGSNYKGSPSISDNKFGFQPYSPGGGLNSSLYKASRAGAESPLSIDYVPGANKDLMNPDTLEAYQLRFSDKKENKSCLSGLGLDLANPFSGFKCSLFSQKESTPDPDWNHFYGNELAKAKADTKLNKMQFDLDRSIETETSRKGLFRSWKNNNTPTGDRNKNTRGEYSNIQGEYPVYSQYGMDPLQYMNGSRNFYGQNVPQNIPQNRLPLDARSGKMNFSFKGGFGNVFSSKKKSPAPSSGNSRPVQAPMYGNGSPMYNGNAYPAPEMNGSYSNYVPENAQVVGPVPSADSFGQVNSFGQNDQFGQVDQFGLGDPGNPMVSADAGSTAGNTMSVNRIPMTRATEEAVVSPGTEELPSSILRKQGSSSDRAFAEDGLPMEFVPNN
ncbi:MAG: MlaD family protein [Planctomycetia bacterium]|nr:MlaD family protein [Planctomycetia bacterium]